MGLTCCSNQQDLKQTAASEEVWFKQSNVVLGAKIYMKSIEEGVAISRGAGFDKKGNLFIFNEGKWETVFEFDYSDNPQIAYYNDKIWFIHHQSHHNFWKPRFYEYDGTKAEEVKIPIVMWDETDYCIWNDIEVLDDGTAWMVGQLGNILRFDGNAWREFKSPLKNVERKSVYSGDFNDVDFINDSLGWAVGREGVIIKFENDKWHVIDSPSNVELKKISMVNENFGWIVGDQGTILIYENQNWKDYESEYRIRFNSIISDGKDKAWIVGTRSTLLVWNGEVWTEVESIKSFNDIFEDIDFAKDEDNNYKLWVIGQNGIYTTSQNLGFSFTDITNESSLRGEGRAATFFDGNSDGLLDIALYGDGNPNLIYQNLGGNSFSEISRTSFSTGDTPLEQAFSFGEIDGDSNPDLLEILDDINYNLAFGKGDFNFSTDERSKLNLDVIGYDLAQITAKFIDFDNDGDLDLYVSNFNRDDMLFENDGLGHFTNVYESAGINKNLNRQSFGVVFNDLNNDMLVDVLIVYRFAEDQKFMQLFLNKGNLKFEEKVSDDFTSDIALASYSAISNDFNNDGTQDILVYNNTKPSYLYLNDGSANFKLVEKNVGFVDTLQHIDPSNGILNAGDINNDGYLDVFISSQLYLNSPELYFSEVSEQVGINFTGNPSFGDVDNDGDLDLFIGIRKTTTGVAESVRLFRNNLNTGNSIKVRFSTDETSRSAIGTRATLIGQNLSGEQKYKTTRYFGLGEAPISQQNLSELHFGLIDTLAYKLEVTFPSGKQQFIDDIKPGKIYTVNESSFPAKQSILISKSFERSVNLIDKQTELIKLLIFLAIVGLIYYQTKQMKAFRVIKKLYFVFSFVLLYLLLVHFTVKTNIFFEWLLPIFLPSLFLISFIYITNKIIDERESKYISHYKIHDIIGMGGMGKVFKATDTQTNKLVALKILNPTLLKDDENKRRLNSEGRLLSSLNHPNIVKVFEFGETDKHSYLAMEYLTGGTLEEFIENNYPLPLEKFKDIALQICEGLIVIHESNVLHRDLKSQNIMFDEEGKLRIMDFGLSKSPLVSTMTSLGTVVGTLGYVAPEQVTNIEVDQRTDIFSFGVTLYQLLTKRLPFTGENEMALIHSIFNNQPPVPSSINEKVDKRIDELVLRCIEKDANKRYQSAEEIKAEIYK